MLNITNRFQDIGFTFIASVISRIRWTADPKEASGVEVRTMPSSWQATPPCLSGGA